MADTREDKSVGALADELGAVLDKDLGAEDIPPKQPLDDDVEDGDVEDGEGDEGDEDEGDEEEGEGDEDEGDEDDDEGEEGEKGEEDEEEAPEKPAPKRKPKKLLIHIRGPGGRGLSSVRLNGNTWDAYYSDTIVVPEPESNIYLNVKYAQ